MAADFSEARRREARAGPRTPAVRVGILGAARIARKNARAISRVPGSAKVTAIASRSVDKAAALAAEVGLSGKAALVGSYAALLESPLVDAVYVPLPTAMHSEWVARAAAAGKHILLEKPVALDDVATDEIVAAARAAGVALLDGTMFSHDLRWSAVDRALAGGDLGAPSHVYAVFSFDGAALPEGDVRTQPDLDGLGCLGDIGWYCIRAALRVFGWEPPVRVLGHAGAARFENGVLRQCGATLEFSGGRIATVECSFDRAFEQRVAITTDRKVRVEVQDAFLPENNHYAAFMVTGKASAGNPSQRARRTTIRTPLPQESRMWQQFAKICAEPQGEASLEAMRRTALTQRVVNAVARSLKSSLPEPARVRELSPYLYSSETSQHDVKGFLSELNAAAE